MDASPKHGGTSCTLSPHAPGGLKVLFTCVTVFLVAAAVYASVLIVQRQKALYETSRYNTTWLVSQAPLEVAKLQTAVAEATIPGTAVDQDKVQLWLDIVANRVQLLNNGEARGFISTNPGLGTIAREFRDTITAAQPLVDSINRRESALQLLERLSALEPKLTELATASYTLSGRLAASDLEQLEQLHWIFSGVLFGLILCSCGLIAALSRHNRLLSRAHQEVNRLLSNLQQTSEELTVAHEDVRRAMSEVQLQNEILKERDVELHMQNARFHAALNNMSQALCMTDADQRMIICNSRFIDLFGISENAARPGTAMADVFQQIRSTGTLERDLVGSISGDQQTLVFTHSCGTFIRESATGRALAVAHQPMAGGGWVATYEDVTERRRAEARIRYLAHHDALTNLPNRVLFHDRMESMLRGLRGDGDALAVLCLDLDYFKNVNDSLGHPVGDALLEVVAQRLLRSVRDGDLVARTGGDEFAILQFSTDQPTHAEMLAKRIVETLHHPYELDGQQAILGVSIGIALATAPGLDPDLLLRNADTALYRAKNAGRSTYCFFEAQMAAEVQSRRDIELALRTALAQGELELYFQPFFALHDGRISGFEALLRWHHPERGAIPPGDFIPVAEDLGLIAPLGEWVLRQACAAAATWPEHIRVAVNLSPAQFRRDKLAHVVKQALEGASLAPGRLELEITESTLLQDNEKVVATLHELRDLGVRIALDDFGTGYSSLHYLRCFPFDRIKIDQSFVKEMGSRPDCRAIVYSVANLARELGITTTAEGVETIEQLKQVRDAGCVEAQGYYFDRPVPLSAIPMRLAELDSYEACAA